MIGVERTWIGVGVALCLLVAPRPTPASTPKTTDGTIVMKWSSPPREPSAELERWHADYVAALAPVEAAWVDLLRRMSRHRPARFETQCRALSRELEVLDRGRLLPAPEPLLDIHLKRMLSHLDRSAIACQGHELFNVVYRLEEARHALVEVRELLAGRRLTSNPPSGRSPPR